MARKGILLLSVLATVVSIEPLKAQAAPNCPPGYRCEPIDPFASRSIDLWDRAAEARKRACEESRAASEELAVGDAARARPGDPGAVSEALNRARLGDCR